MQDKLFLSLFKKRNQNLLQILVIVTFLLNFSLSIVSYAELAELTMFFILSKKPTSLCSPISLSIPVRFMIKKTASVVPGITSNPELNQHISRQVLGLIKIITNEEVVNGLSKNNDPKAFIKQSLNFILDSEGNTILKTNFLTASFRNPLILDAISPVYKLLHEKSPMTFNQSNQPVYLRIFAEIGINHKWVMEHKNVIQSSLITGDTIETTSKTQPYPDKIDTYKNGKVVHGDIKSGNEMSKWPLKGTLGEVTYLNGKQLVFPNNEVDIDTFNKERAESIIGHKNYFGISKEDKKEFMFCTEKILILNDNLNLDKVKKHLEVEALMVRVNMLASQKRISFIHVTTCVELPLTEKEKSFINLLSSQIENRAIFDNQYKYNKFIIESLILYHKTVDNTTKEKLQLLTYSAWKPTFIDEIDFTLFN